MPRAAAVAEARPVPWSLPARHRRTSLAPNLRTLLVGLVVVAVVGSGLGTLALGAVPSAKAAGSAAPTIGPLRPSSASTRAQVTPSGTTTPIPLTVLATVSVGREPEFATYDTNDGDLYVPNWGSNNVSVVHGTTVVASVTVGGIPFSATYDPANHDVYVVNNGSNNVTVISGTSVVGNVRVGTGPQFASYDSANGFVYVNNYASANVTVINGTTVAATIPVGSGPTRVVVGVVGGGGGGGGGGGWVSTFVHPAATSSVIYVPNSRSNNVTVVGGPQGKTVLASVHVGTGPQFGTWDPSNVWLYVPNTGSGNVSVLTSTSPYSVLTSVAVGSRPFSASYDPTTNQVLVTNFGSGTVSVLGGSLAETLVATIHVGTGPEFVTQDPAPLNDLLVPNTGSNNVSIISGTAVVGTLPSAGEPIFGTLDPATHDVYVQDFGATTMSVIGASLPVTFKALGLPAGSSWSVTAGSPPTTQSNTTVGKKGSLLFDEAPGPLNYTIGAPVGYGVAKITGTGLPNQTSDTIMASSTLTIKFGHLETFYFNESSVAKFELYHGATWSVSLVPALPHGGPSPRANGTNGTSIRFIAPAGAAFKFQVTGPGVEYAALPAKGGLHVPPHVLTKVIKFRLITVKVLFQESGLTKGASWTITFTSGTTPALVFPLSATGTGSSLVFFLPVGSYNYTVTDTSSQTPTPSGGTVTILGAPSTAQTIPVSF